MTIPPFATTLFHLLSLSTGHDDFLNDPLMILCRGSVEQAAGVQLTLKKLGFGRPEQTLVSLSLWSASMKDTDFTRFLCSSALLLFICLQSYLPLL